MQSTPFTIGRLAAEAGVNVETVRFYQRRGLLREPLRPHNGVRRYHLDDLDRLRFIRRAKVVGFSLEEIAELMAAKGRGACAQTARMLDRKLADVRERIKELRALESDLAAMATACSSASADDSCPALGLLRETVALER